MRTGSRIASGARIIKNKLLHRLRPLFVQFSVTNKCNKKCVYCDYPLREQRELETKEVFFVIDGLRYLGTARINLLGGEPLLREDIGEIVDYIIGRGMQCVMTSNGTLVPQEINVVRKLDQCTVSLDGDEATNDKNRGRGSYKEAIQAIELLKKFKVPVLISAVLSKYSLDSVDSLLKEAQRLGCAVSINIPYHSPENGRSALSAMAEDARYKKTITQIIKAKKNGLPVLFSVVTYRYTLQWPTYKIDMDTHRDVNFKGPTCSAGRYFGYIDTNGDFYPCILYNNRDKFKALNCIEDGVQRAWDNCKTHPCSACFIPCYVEYNYLFSLDWRVIRNVWFSGIWRRFPPVIKT